MLLTLAKHGTDRQLTGRRHMRHAIVFEIMHGNTTVGVFCDENAGFFGPFERVLFFTLSVVG